MFKAARQSMYEFNRCMSALLLIMQAVYLTQNDKN